MPHTLRLEWSNDHKFVDWHPVAIARQDVLNVISIVTFQVREIFMGPLTHWGRVTHICVGKLISIGSDNGLSPGRRQAITWTNAGILLIGPLGTNFSGILIEIQTFSLKKIRLKMLKEISAILSRPQCVDMVVMVIGNLTNLTWHKRSYTIYWCCS